MRKRRIVLNDKAKIAALITELDEKKNEALKKAYTQVNRVRKYNMYITANMYNSVLHIQQQVVHTPEFFQ